MAETRRLTLPVTGMTCANCVATIERSLKRVSGVQGAAVNLSSERATVEFDPTLVFLPDLIGRVERAGYGIATGEADLIIRRMSDITDATRLEAALHKVEGVLSAHVDFVGERARIQYIQSSAREICAEPSLQRGSKRSRSVARLKMPRLWRVLQRPHTSATC